MRRAHFQSPLIINLVQLKEKSVSAENSYTQTFVALSLCAPWTIHFIIFDDATRLSCVKLESQKLEAYQAVMNTITELVTQNGCKIKASRTENGGEYENEIRTIHLAQRGIHYELTPPHSPESNGIAESSYRSIGEDMSSILSTIFKKHPWSEAIYTFVYTKIVYLMVLYVVSLLQPFGRECYLYIPKSKRPSGSKFLPRAEKVI